MSKAIRQTLERRRVSIVAAQQGWSDNSVLELALQHIQQQEGDLKGFADMMEKQAKEENDSTIGA